MHLCIAHDDMEWRGGSHPGSLATVLALVLALFVCHLGRYDFVLTSRCVGFVCFAW